MNDSSIQYKSYSDDQSNVPGALLFLGYIVAALVFSIRIWTIIWHRYTSRTASKSLNVKAKRSITLSAVIALLSFSVLSYNMLSFLVLSYQDWTRRKGINESFMFHPALLWQWMSHATLFEDFARSLVATPARSLWTQLALLQTYHIVTKVHRAGHVDREGLGELIALSQILPVSYTLGLFYLLRGTASQGPEEKKMIKTPSSRSPSAALIGALYVLLVGVIPYMGDTADFMPVVLLIRGMLVLPFLLGKGNDISSTYKQATCAAGLSMIASQAILSIGKKPGSIPEIWSALFEHPSVRALGQDAVIGFVGNSIHTLFNR